MVDAEVGVENGGSEKTEEAKKPLTSEEEDVLHRRIIIQVEYYFSDVNIARDRFIQEQTKLDDGWMPLDTLVKFNRLAAITSDREAVVQALRKAQTVELSEEGDKVRRKGGMPGEYEEIRRGLMLRTIYCKGFPIQGDNLPTFDQLLTFFNSFGHVDSVLMRHYVDKVTKERGFKGSCFVIFPTVEAAQAFLDLEDVKYLDIPLVRKWQSDYIDNKRKERLEEKLNRQARRRDNKRKGGGGKEEEGGEEKKRSGGLVKGTVVGLSWTDSLDKEKVRQAVENLGFSVAFIDLTDNSGYLRLQQPDTAAELVEKCEGGKLKVGEDKEMEVRVLEAEEELNYLDRVRKEINKKRQGGFNKRRRGGGRGGDRGGRKRKGDAGDESAPPAKVAAADKE